VKILSKRPLDLGLDQIKSLLYKMGKLAIDSLDTALKGFFSNEDVYVQLRAWSNTILLLSEEVEDRATELMALHQPMAGDLRTLKAYIKVAYDIERYGRYSMDISEIKSRLGEWEAIPDNSDFTFLELGEVVKKCLSKSINYIVTMDKDAIFELSEIETESDVLYRKNLKMLWESNLSTKTVIAYTLTIRYLERIADHSSYISESIYYAITGRRISLR
jgi:phosphate transport system protein